ncbi:MAG: hypothetical protein ACM3N0_00050 [Chloroflexota bacterium]
MRFHVQLSSEKERARVFNLSREELLARVIEPWLAGRTFEIAEYEWLPSESELKILEGPHLDNPDLAIGQGWSNAERKSENVTRRVLAEAPAPKLPDAFVVAGELPEATVAEMLAEQEARPVEWSEAHARIDGRDPEVAAVILVLRQPGAEPRS